MSELFWFELRRLAMPRDDNEVYSVYFRVEQHVNKRHCRLRCSPCRDQYYLGGDGDDFQCMKTLMSLGAAPLHIIVDSNVRTGEKQSNCHHDIHCLIRRP